MRKTVYALAFSALAFGGPTQPAMAQAALADGVVRKIDPSAGKITLHHGPIKKLDMDTMTMVFRVKDEAMLVGLKPGDRVKFDADRVNGAITILTIQKVK